MNQRVEGIEIEHAIMHELDRESNILRLADRPVKLDFSSKQFLARLLQVCLSQAEIQAVDINRSHVVVACRDVLADANALVVRSRELAEKLYGTMRGKENISSGDLFVVVASDSEGPVLGLFKTEQSAEYTRTYMTEPDGTITPVLTANNNVIPSERRPPQKCAFVRHAQPGCDYDVLLIDNQVGESGAVAKFFYHDFLECELLTTNAARTVAFCKAAEIWRRENKAALPLQGVVSFTKALNEHLAARRLNFRAFADTALSPLSDSQLTAASLAEYLAGKVYHDKSHPWPDEFEPDRSIADILLSNTSLTLEGGVQISGPASQLTDVLESIRESGNGNLNLRLEAPSLRRNFQKPRAKREESNGKG